MKGCEDVGPWAGRPLAQTMMKSDEVEAMLHLYALGWGLKRIAREFGCSKNTVRRYVEAAPGSTARLARRLRARARRRGPRRRASPSCLTTPGALPRAERLDGGRRGVLPRDRALSPRSAAVRSHSISSARIRTARVPEWTADVRPVGELIGVYWHPVVTLCAAPRSGRETCTEMANESHRLRHLPMFGDG